MSLQFAILGLLNYSNLTGYDLKKAFDSTLAHFWTAQTSQIYRDLNTLEEKKYVRHTVVNQEDRPDKKIFEITDEGRSAFIDWLKDYPKNEILREPMLLHMFFSGALETVDVIRELEAYKESLKSRLAAIESIGILNEKQPTASSEKMQRENMFWKFCAMKGKYSYEANIQWAEKILELLKDIH